GITLKRVADALTKLPTQLRFHGALTDLRYAARSLRKSPGYAATVIGVLALSMALAITVFTVVDGVLFKPLPYPRVDELVAIDAARARYATPGASFGVSPSDFFAWKSVLPDAQLAAYH